MKVTRFEYTLACGALALGGGLFGFGAAISDWVFIAMGTFTTIGTMAHMGFVWGHIHKE